MKIVSEEDILSATAKLEYAQAELQEQETLINALKIKAPLAFFAGRSPRALAAELGEMNAACNILRAAVDLAQAEVDRLKVAKPAYEGELKAAQAEVDKLEVVQIENIKKYIQSVYASWQAALTSAAVFHQASAAAREHRNQIGQRATAHGMDYLSEVEAQLSTIEVQQTAYFAAAKVPNRSERRALAAARGVGTLTF